MHQEGKTIVKKAAKIAGVTCLALGSAALIASGAALKAMTEGAKYLKDTIEKIITGDQAADTPAEETVQPPAEAVAEETDFADTEDQT